MIGGASQGGLTGANLAGNVGASIAQGGTGTSGAISGGAGGVTGGSSGSFVGPGFGGGSGQAVPTQGTGGFSQGLSRAFGIEKGANPLEQAINITNSKGFRAVSAISNLGQGASLSDIGGAASEVRGAQQAFQGTPQKEQQQRPVGNPSLLSKGEMAFAKKRKPQAVQRQLEIPESISRKVGTEARGL